MARKKRATVVAKPRTKKTTKRKELTLLGQALRTLGGLGGGAIGGIMGNPVTGASVGTSLGAAISKWLGSGDYSVQQNSIVTASMKGSNAIPMMHNLGQSVTIRHKEFLCTIKGSRDFTLQRFFLLQPGDTNTFPWLSGVANRFQQYRIKGMVFHYVPTSGYAVSGTDPALGAVMIQTSYRANDSDPTSKVEMMNEYWASENIPSDSFCHPVECSPKENPFQVHYVRTLPVPTGDSPLLYDIGKTYVATQGMPDDGKNVGDLWVTYEIELMKPQISSNVLSETLSGFASASSGVAPGNPLGVAALTSTGPLNYTILSRTITFPVGTIGRFLVTIVWPASGTYSAFDSAGAPTYTNCAGTPVGPSGFFNSFTTFTAGASATLGRGFYLVGVNITDPSNVANVQIPACTWTGTALRAEVTITEF